VTKRTLKQYVADQAKAELSDKDLILEAEGRGFLIHKPKPPEALTVELDMERVRGTKRLRLAALSCTHFGSKYQQVTALREFCAYAKRERVDYLVHAGDVTDGPFKKHKNPHEVFLHDYERVVDYSIDTLPKVGIPWLMISGNHDDWWTDDGGPDVIKAIAAERDDVTYLGRSLGYLRVEKNFTIEVVHPNQGSAYAYSYRLQKHIESLSPTLKPSLCLMGNFHKFCSVYYRNVLGLQLPAFQSQTPWMAGKSLVSEVGGIILEVGQHAKGLAPATKFEVVYEYEPREDDWPH
jgi:predicted phosphodiesterase